MFIVVTDISFFVLRRWTREELKKVIAMLQDPEFENAHADSSHRGS